MKIGTMLRNMGTEANAECLLHCARYAEELGFRVFELPPLNKTASD